VQIDDFTTFVVADIPGLIEGASTGTGLGHEFLRHIERTRVLIHLIDGNSNDPLEEWAMINQELALYDSRLEEKPQIVVLNKIDLPDAVAWEPIIEEKITRSGFQFTTISAVTGQGLSNLLFLVLELLDKSPKPKQDISELVVIRPEPDEDSFQIVREDGNWRVLGTNIERIAAMTYWEFEATTRRFPDGDTVIIGDEVLEWSE
jgi:GTP-binding protein